MVGVTASRARHISEAVRGEGMITKSCPRCGALLEVRTNPRTGIEGLACSRPGCPRREKIPVDLVLRALGAPLLPGIEARELAEVTG